jgi:hypothetical protein
VLTAGFMQWGFPRKFRLLFVLCVQFHFAPIYWTNLRQTSLYAKVDTLQNYCPHLYWSIWENHTKPHHTLNFDRVDKPHHTTPELTENVTTPHQNQHLTTPHGVVLPIYADDLILFTDGTDCSMFLVWRKWYARKLWQDEVNVFPTAKVILPLKIKKDFIEDVKFAKQK